MEVLTEKHRLTTVYLMLCTLGVIGFLNCDEISVCGDNQFELLEFLFDSVFVGLQYDQIPHTFTAGSVSLCCGCSHVVIFGLSVVVEPYNNNNIYLKSNIHCI